MFARLTSKLIELSSGRAVFNKTPNGKNIIPIGKDYGLYDVLVYVNDDFENPKITRVIKLNEFADEYLKEIVWKEF